MENTQKEGSGGKIMVTLPSMVSPIPMNTWQLYNYLSGMSMQQHAQMTTFGQPLASALQMMPNANGGLQVIAPTEESGLVPTAGPQHTVVPAENAMSPTMVGQVVSPTLNARPSGEQGAAGSVQLQNQDGYKWRKYGQKCLKKTSDGAVEILKSYYRCNFPGCPMRKQVERFAATDQVRVVHFIGSFHNHPPSNDNPLRTTQWASDDSLAQESANHHKNGKVDGESLRAVMGVTAHSSDKVDGPQ